MPIAVSSAQSREKRIWKTLKNGTGYYRSPYVNDDNSGRREGPTCYLIEQDPDSVINAHFHQANQFQVMIEGGGKLGKRDIGPVVVHYTDSYTPYGPINAGNGGLSYFTLRDGFDPGARFMPEQRAELVRRHGHHRHLVSNFAPAGGSDMAREELLAEQGDGLKASVLRLGGGEAVPGHDPASGGGQFWLVVSGTLTHDGRAIGPRGCIYVAPEDAALSAVASDEGAEIILMQFPRAEEL